MTFGWSAHSVPGSVLSTLYIFTHWLFATTLLVGTLPFTIFWMRVEAPTSKWLAHGHTAGEQGWDLTQALLRMCALVATHPALLLVVISHLGQPLFLQKEFSTAGIEVTKLEKEKGKLSFVPSVLLWPITYQRPQLVAFTRSLEYERNVTFKQKHCQLDVGENILEWFVQLRQGWLLYTVPCKVSHIFNLQSYIPAKTTASFSHLNDSQIEVLLVALISLLSKLHSGLHIRKSHLHRLTFSANTFSKFRWSLFVRFSYSDNFSAFSRSSFSRRLFSWRNLEKLNGHRLKISKLLYHFIWCINQCFGLRKFVHLESFSRFRQKQIFKNYLSYDPKVSLLFFWSYRTELCYPIL